MEQKSASPVGTTILTRHLGQSWRAHIKGHETPIGYGATQDEAVRKLKLHFPSLLVEPVTVE